jgi:ribonuclease BN (tRNA processing enzyme)
MNRVVTLGTKDSPSLQTATAMPTSSLLDLDGQQTVIDAGLGVSCALVRAGVQLNALSTIFITHLHSDHILGLGPLVHTAWPSGIKDAYPNFWHRRNCGLLAGLRAIDGI